MFGLGGIYLILLKQRVPFGPRGRSRWWWASSQLSNLAIALTISLVCWAVGLETFIKVHAPVFLVYTTVGIWLFFAEHQFQNTYWRSEGEWNFHEAGIFGSSYLALPRPLQWLTANIGIHHVHHLNPRIPNYRLQEYIRAREYLADTNRLTFRDAIRATRLALWDPGRSQLVAFRDLASCSTANRFT
jgi:omega-6 fatty acid desaturase (delta-12 desaturase)